jgi:hypothetical protein
LEYNLQMPLKPDERRRKELTDSILAEVQELTSSIKPFALAIDKLGVTVQEQADAVRKNTKATEETTKQKYNLKPSACGFPENFKPPIAVSIQGETKTKITDSVSGGKVLRFVIEIATLGVLIWYACTTRELWKESHKQTESNDKQLKLSQRAVLIITNVGNKSENGRQLQLFVQNQGASPGTIRTIQATYTRTVKATNLPLAAPVTIISTVSDPQAISRETSRYMITVNLPILTVDEEKQVASSKIIESIFGKFDFEDGFGGMAITNFCAIRDTKTLKWSDDNCAVGPAVDFTKHPH